jgi:GNAT superfamily N-acetyltransferase
MRFSALKRMLETKAMNQLELKPMHTCSFETALEVWNEGFKGYFVDMTLTLDRLLDRLTASRVSPEHSLIAMDGDTPVGFLFNAIQVIGNKKFAWNGGTGVVPAYRGKGVGKELMKATMGIYEANNVAVASLEAISSNHSAINLYKRFGYEAIEELSYLQTTTPRLIEAGTTRYEVVNVHPSAVGHLEFYRELSPWQCQWQSLALRGGEAIVVLERDNTPIGYALFEKRFDEKGNLTRIALFQCEVASGRSDEKEISELMLRRVFVEEEVKYQRTTVNFPKSNVVVIDLLKDAGFTTFIEQLHMILNFR